MQKQPVSNEIKTTLNYSEGTVILKLWKQTMTRMGQLHMMEQGDRLLPAHTGQVSFHLSSAKLGISWLAGFLYSELLFPSLHWSLSLQAFFISSLHLLVLPFMIVKLTSLITWVVLSEKKSLSGPIGGSAAALAPLVRCEVIRHMDTEDSGHLFAVVPNLECMEDVRMLQFAYLLTVSVHGGCMKKETRAAYSVIVGVWNQEGP